MYKNRHYRKFVQYSNLVNFEVVYYESDLLISAQSNLKQKAYQWLVYYHDQISNYIRHNPVFEKTLVPVSVCKSASLIVKTMADASRKANVGPMAAVAGAVAEFVGRKLLKFSKEVIVENGGDIFISACEERKVGIFAGVGSMYNRLCLKLSPEDTPCGICTSSGTIGHSLSFGKTMATVVIARSAAVADSFATAIGNLVSHEEDISHALKFARRYRLIKGLIIITGKQLAAYGRINFDILDK